MRLHRLDALDEWVNGAYDEYGNTAVCDLCGGDLKWNPVMCEWYCRECEQIFDRKTYFNHIGANPPGEFCLKGCEENYPFCKRECGRYDIPDDDPMMD